MKTINSNIKKSSKRLKNYDFNLDFTMEWPKSE